MSLMTNLRKLLRNFVRFVFGCLPVAVFFLACSQWNWLPLSQPSETQPPSPIDVAQFLLLLSASIWASIGVWRAHLLGLALRASYDPVKDKLVWKLAGFVFRWNHMSESFGLLYEPIRKPQYEQNHGFRNQYVREHYVKLSALLWRRKTSSDLDLLCVCGTIIRTQLYTATSATGKTYKADVGGHLSLGDRLLLRAELQALRSAYISRCTDDLRMLLHTATVTATSKKTLRPPILSIQGVFDCGAGKTAFNQEGLRKYLANEGITLIDRSIERNEKCIANSEEQPLHCESMNGSEEEALLEWSEGKLHKDLIAHLVAVGLLWKPFLRFDHKLTSRGKFELARIKQERSSNDPPARPDSPGGEDQGDAE